jgi:endo-1,4-beta-D-glucanase Y
MRSSILSVSLMALTITACITSDEPLDDTDLAAVAAAPLDVATVCRSASADVAMPFGAAPGYAAGVILPSNRTRAQLNAATASYYAAWKQRYFKRGCGSGRAYIATGMDDSLTVSEAHGYGMILMPLMAGQDPDAHAAFDALYKFFRAHPTSGSPDLMAWSQDSRCKDNQGVDSATDGDLDIAYGLLLADRQWGSNGAIKYKAEALKVIRAILARDVSSNAGYTLLGDWVTASDAEFYDSTRTSDFMPGHFTAFAAASGDARWTTLVDKTWTMVGALQSKYAPATGLLPDFVQHPANPKPAPADFLEGANDGAYSWNACRDPFRLAIPFLTSGDARARTAMQKLNTWIRSKTGNSPSKIKAGYKLNGNAASGDTNFLTMAYAAPFGVSAMVDGSNQAWLNTVWNTVESAPSEGYYEDTIKLLTMIAMSGNWWTPTSGPSLCAAP